MLLEIDRRPSTHFAAYSSTGRLGSKRRMNQASSAGGRSLKLALNATLLLQSSIEHPVRTTSHKVKVVAAQRPHRGQTGMTKAATRFYCPAPHALTGGRTNTDAIARNNKESKSI